MCSSQNTSELAKRESRGYFDDAVSSVVDSAITVLHSFKMRTSCGEDAEGVCERASLNSESTSSRRFCARGETARIACNVKVDSGPEGNSNALLNEASASS